MKRRAVGIVLAGVAACRASVPLSSPVGVDPTPSAAIDASVVAPRLATVDAAAPSARPPAPPTSSILSLGYAPGGALVVIKADAIVTFPREGAPERVALGSGEVVDWRGGRSLVVSDGDDARLFTVSPLREVYRGRARSLPSGDGLVEAGPGGEGSDAAVVVVPPRGGTAARLSPLPSGAGARIAAVDLTDDGRFAVVTAVVTDEEGHESGVAKAYDVARGRPTVAALPAGTGFGNPPTATLVGARQVGFRGGDLVVLDLASGGTLRRVPFPCGSKSEDFHARGNPTVDPTGRSLLVTCDRDGVLFDYPSLRRVRTFPDLVPGCDNGFFLDGHFARDGRSFVLHGCGGESRLEVRSGRFLCGDDDGLMGAPYGMGISVERVKPARAVGVPPCHPREELERGLASLAEHYRLESAETGATVVSTASPSTRIAVPSSGALPVVSSDESRLATSDGVHVTEYALPSGTPVRTVDP